MKRVFSFFVVAAIFLSLGVNSCTNEDPAKPLEIDLTRTATITGVLLHNADTETSPMKWTPLPHSFTVDNFYVTVDYCDLTDCFTGGVYVLPKSMISYNNTNGKYTITVPVGKGYTEVTVKIRPFEGELREPGNTVTVIWREDWDVEDLTPGEVWYKDFLWDSWCNDPVVKNGDNV